ncbi:MAG TPA: hypothetical protein VK153_03780 [Candidatus Paceibacterota bacterium]|nr:hypothetical protein [Candidatus Paceibacterota bacterium]
MSRLPIVGQDNNTWGTVLNDYLAVEHNEDGTQKLLTEDVSRTIYVSATGNDTTGDGSEALPYLTIGKALSTIKKNIGNGVTVTISIGEGTFDISLDDFNIISSFQGAGTLAFTGILSLVESGFTMGSAQALDPLTYTVSGGSTGSWSTNQWQYYFLKSGTTYYPITHNTSSTLSHTRESKTGTEIYELKTNLIFNGDLKCNIIFIFNSVKITFINSSTFFYTTLSYYNEFSTVYFYSSSSKILQLGDMYGGIFRYSCFQNLRILTCDAPDFNFNYVYANGNFTAFEKRGLPQGSLRTNVFENPNTSSGASALTFMGNISSYNFYVKIVNSNVALMEYAQNLTRHWYKNIVLVNTNYLVRRISGASTVSTELYIDNILGTPNTRYFYDTQTEFVSSVSGRKVQIRGLLYPEYESNLSATLADNTTTNVIIGNKLQNQSIVIDYTIKRGTTYETAQLRILNDGTNLTLQEGTPLGDVGVTFAVNFNTNEIRLACTLTSTGTAATLKYNATRVMITPLTI